MINEVLEGNFNEKQSSFLNYMLEMMDPSHDPSDSFARKIRSLFELNLNMRQMHKIMKYEIDAFDKKYSDEEEETGPGRLKHKRIPQPEYTHQLQDSISQQLNSLEKRAYQVKDIAK